MIDIKTPEEEKESRLKQVHKNCIGYGFELFTEDQVLNPEKEKIVKLLLLQDISITLAMILDEMRGVKNDS